MARPPPPATVRSYQVPAPVGGLNTAESGLSIPPTDCVQVYNLVPAENGLRSRLGSVEWVTGIDDIGQEVRSLLPFSGQTSNRLFATNEAGLWDVSDSTDAPTEVLSFPLSGATSGIGVSTNIVTAGGHFLVYCDELNGLYVFDETGNTWAKVASGTGPDEIDGVDPGDLVFCMVFKERLWFVERGTGSAWYLPPGQVFGAATEFPMGVKFRHGGTLVGLWDWTYDGGSGADDSLVAISSGGDVLVWQGVDPDDVTFGLRGVWYVGKPPYGRLIASDFGGDLLILTRQGVTAMSRLVVGIPDARAEQLTVKIANLFNAFMETRAEQPGWSINRHPEDNTLIVTVPQGTETARFQLVQAVATKGWFLYRDLDMRCATEWDGQLYFGTTDGRVLKNTGYLDGVLLSDENAYTPIDWALITAFSDLGAPTQKQVQMLRPLFKVDGVPPSARLQAKYQYNTSELDPVLLALSGAGAWGSMIWGTDVWGGDGAPVAPVRGATGMGSSVAVAVRGVSISRTVLVRIEVVYTAGGWL